MSRFLSRCKKSLIFMNFFIILLFIKITFTLALHIYHENLSNENEKETIQNKNLIEGKYESKDHSKLYADFSVDKIHELDNETYKRKFTTINI